MIVKIVTQNIRVSGCVGRYMCQIVLFFRWIFFYIKWVITENKSNLLKNLHKLENIKIPGVK